MPNHCTNNLSCTSGKSIGSIIKPYLTKDKDGDYAIDFEKILPMPEGILKTIEYSSIEILTREETEEAREARKKQLDVLREENTKQYGFPDWYEWCVENWGTKWNAYNHWTWEGQGEDIGLDDVDSIGFQTAWSPPLPIVKQLAKLTGESLRMSYYDEGWMFGGEYLVDPDGSEVDNCYEDIDDVPDELREELDVEFYLEHREEDEEDEEEEEVDEEVEKAIAFLESKGYKVTK